MKRRINILFLGGAKRVSVARLLIAAGNKRDVQVRIYGYELDTRVPLAEIGEIIPGKKWSDMALMEDLDRVVKEYGIDIMLPFVDGAIEIVSQYVTSHPEIYSPVSDTAVAKTFFDKKLSSKAFAAAGLPAPVSYYGTPEEFPVIAKPRHGSASKGIMVLHDEKEFNSAGINFDDYEVQQYIARREEITADCFVGQDGEVLAVSPRIRLETAGGEAVRTLTIDDNEAVKLAEDTLSRLNLRGAVTIQLLRDLTSGRLMLMEINPRLGGGVVASIHAGADVAGLIIDEFLKIPLHRQYPLAGTLMTRYFQEVMFYGK